MPILLKERTDLSKLIRYGIYCLIATMITAGCTAHDPYPENWPLLQAIENESCIFSPAVYRNMNREKWGQPRLADVLLETSTIPFFKVVYVEITQPAKDILNVGLYNAKGECMLNKTLSISKGEYRCLNGWIQRTGSTTSSGRGSALRGTDHFTNQLIEQQGYLIFKKSYTSRGWFGVIPIWGSGSFWGRFHLTNQLRKSPQPCPE